MNETHKSHLMPCISETTIGGTTEIVYEAEMDPEDPMYPRLNNIFGPQVPRMELPHGGATGYLDYLKPDDLPATIAKGIDPHGRPFFAMRVLVYKEGPDGAREHRAVLVLQRRYEKGKVWVQAGNVRLPEGTGPITNATLEAVKTLKTEGRVEWKSWDDCRIVVTLFPNP